MTLRHWNENSVLKIIMIDPAWLWAEFQFNVFNRFRTIPAKQQIENMFYSFRRVPCKHFRRDRIYFIRCRYEVWRMMLWGYEVMRSHTECRALKTTVRPNIRSPIHFCCLRVYWRRWQRCRPHENVKNSKHIQQQNCNKTIVKFRRQKKYLKNN